MTVGFAKIRSSLGTFHPGAARPPLWTSVALLIALAPIILQAQVPPSPNRTQAIDTVESQAERRAEDSASLSPEKLIELLHQEPGLLLEVKKDLFRRAFEQGAILESRDLNDEALFRLLREDESVRVLATQEVTRRFYIRVLPTDEERRREAAGLSRRYGEKDSPQRPSRGTLNLEDRYWSAQGNQAASPQTSPTPPSNSPGSEPLPRVDFEERRALERAGFDSDEPNDTNTMISPPPPTAGRVEAEDLPGLVRTGSASQLIGGSELGAAQAPRPETDRQRSYGADLDRPRALANGTSSPMPEQSPSNQGPGNAIRRDLSMRSSLRLDYSPLATASIPMPTCPRSTISMPSMATARRRSLALPKTFSATAPAIPTSFPWICPSVSTM